MGRQKNTTAVGLDIGSHTVKCIEVSRDGDKIQLLRMTLLPIGDGSPATIAKVLDTIFQAEDMESKRIRVSVSGSNVLTRRIALPMMTPAELKGAIRFEAEKHIPFAIDDCLIDFQIVGQNPSKKNMNVLLVAAKKDFVLDRIKLLNDCRIQPELIDVDIFCLLNAFEVLGEDHQGAYGLLNIGHKSSSFAILQENIPFFVREISFAASQITDQIVAQKAISAEEADLLKLDKSAENSGFLKESTAKGFEPLIDEIRHSIDYFENESNEDLKTIWLSGGGALSAAAEEILSQEVGRPVKIWDNFKKIEILGDIDKEYMLSSAPLFNVALGMVLRGVKAGK